MWTLSGNMGEPVRQHTLWTSEFYCNYYKYILRKEAWINSIQPQDVLKENTIITRGTLCIAYISGMFWLSKQRILSSCLLSKVISCRNSLHQCLPTHNQCLYLVSQLPQEWEIPSFTQFWMLARKKKKRTGYTFTRLATTRPAQCRFLHLENKLFCPPSEHGGGPIMHRFQQEAKKKKKKKKSGHFQRRQGAIYAASQRFIELWRWLVIAAALQVGMKNTKIWK